VVRTNALAAVAAAHLEFAVLRLRGFAARDVRLDQHRLQALHRLVAIGVLRALGLRFHDYSAGYVRDADRRFGLVDVLAARAGGAERVDLQVRRIHFDRHARRFFRDDRDGGGGGVDAPLRFGFRHALHAVRARFELEPGIRAAAFDARDDFLEAAMFAGIRRFDFDAPALAFGVTRIHAIQVAGEDRGFVAAGAGAHFQIQVAFVACVARDELRHQFAFQFGQARG